LRALRLLSILSVLLMVGCASLGGAYRVKYPITQATGKYTVRVAFYRSKGDSSAAKLADQMADFYRKAGHEAYVTDLCNTAILSVGSFNDENDPELIATWKREYDKYRKMRGGQDSLYQQQLDRFHEGSGALGDRPWPIKIELLQMRMKRAQGKISRQEYKRYLERTVNPPATMNQ